MINSNDIYKILLYLVEQQAIVQEYINETDPYFEYSIVNDFTIHVEYGFNGYEEDDLNIMDIIMYSDYISIELNSLGNSCIVGKYNTTNTMKFYDIIECMKWIKEQIAYTN